MLAYALVVKLASTGRIKIVLRSVSPAIARRINQTVIDPCDRVFLKVAINSQDHFLTSHDLNHFPLHKRIKIKKAFEVHVKTAGEILSFLTNDLTSQ
jgi:predicted nucleic acid-binding protein